MATITRSTGYETAPGQQPPPDRRGRWSARKTVATLAAVATGIVGGVVGVKSVTGGGGSPGERGPGISAENPWINGADLLKMSPEAACEAILRNPGLAQALDAATGDGSLSCEVGRTGEDGLGGYHIVALSRGDGPSRPEKDINISVYPVDPDGTFDPSVWKPIEGFNGGGNQGYYDEVTGAVALTASGVGFTIWRVNQMDGSGNPVAPEVQAVGEAFAATIR